MLRASMHRLLEEHCSNYIIIYVNVQSADTFAVGKFTTAWVWHKAQQMIRVSLAFGHAWMSDYICMYIRLLVQYIYIIFQTHLDTWVCQFMNKKWFSGLTVSRWPQAGVLTRSFVQLQMGCSLLILCVLICRVIFYWEVFFSTHFHKKHTNLV